MKNKVFEETMQMLKDQNKQLKDISTVVHRNMDMAFKEGYLNGLRNMAEGMRIAYPSDPNVQGQVNRVEKILTDSYNKEHPETRDDIHKLNCEANEA